MLLVLSNDASMPVLQVNTAFGGTKSERGWAVAASGTELYMVGGTASNSWEDAFPLRDFNPNSELDFYQDMNLGGAPFAPFLDFYDFSFGLDYEYSPYGEMWPEPYIQNYDAFIACFSTQYHVGIAEPQAVGAGLAVSPLPVPGQWAVHFPRSASWELAAYNCVGQQVGTWHAGGNATTIDLTGQAAGLYVLRAQAADGQVHTAKLVRP